MARVPLAEPREMGILAGSFTRFVYWLTKRKVGKVVTPVRIVSHHTRILFGYGQMEQALLASKRVDHSLKGLAELRAATLVGCPF